MCDLSVARQNVIDANAREQNAQRNRVCEARQGNSHRCDDSRLLTIKLIEQRGTT